MRELPSGDNEQSRQWVGSHLTTWHNESSLNCSFKRKRRVFSSKFKEIIENVFRELTTVYINCWWWWWSQSSSQLAGSTASWKLGVTHWQRAAATIHSNGCWEPRTRWSAFFLSKWSCGWFYPNWLDSESLFQSFKYIRTKRRIFKIILC